MAPCVKFMVFGKKQLPRRSPVGRFRKKAPKTDYFDAWTAPQIHAMFLRAFPPTLENLSKWNKDAFVQDLQQAWRSCSQHVGCFPKPLNSPLFFTAHRLWWNTANLTHPEQSKAWSSGRTCGYTFLAWIMSARAEEEARKVLLSKLKKKALKQVGKLHTLFLRTSQILTRIRSYFQHHSILGFWEHIWMMAVHHNTPKGGFREKKTSKFWRPSSMPCGSPQLSTTKLDEYLSPFTLQFTVKYLWRNVWWRSSSKGHSPALFLDTPLPFLPNFELYRE